MIHSVKNLLERAVANWIFRFLSRVDCPAHGAKRLGRKRFLARILRTLIGSVEVSVVLWALGLAGLLRSGNVRMSGIYRIGIYEVRLRSLIGEIDG
jgi:hypothetical protein